MSDSVKKKGGHVVLKLHGTESYSDLKMSPLLLHACNTQRQCINLTCARLPLPSKCDSTYA